MAYTINKTNGSILATVADGTVDTSSSVTLVGRNYSGYGEFLGENFVKVLENSANSSAPGSPLAGQLWYDSSNTVLNVYNGTEFKPISSVKVAGSAPSTSLTTGDLWFDSGNSQLNIYNGSSFTLVGPPTSVGSGTSGLEVVTITDNGAVDHVILRLSIENLVVAFISDDAEFTPSPAISGFATIKPGMQLASTVSGASVSQADNSALLDNLASADFLRATANDTTSGTLGVLNDTGLTVGADSDVTISVSGSNATVSNVTSDGDLILSVNDGGVQTTVITVDGATGKALVNVDPTATLGIATKGYVDSQTSGGSASALARNGSNTITGDILPDIDNTKDLGSSTKKFQDIYATTFNGTSTTAQYADLAERFEADAVMEAGTVVELGGINEITQAIDELTDNVFGVISTNAAYLMNAGAGASETHPPVAMNGRVPVKVIGQVSKGDRLVSAGNGFARAATQDEITAFNVIGRSLENKTTNGKGTVEAIVKVN
jgi:hypothetical protein